MQHRYLLTSSSADAYQRIIDFCNINNVEILSWLSDNAASAQAALTHAPHINHISTLRGLLGNIHIDANAFNENNQLKKLLIADMDATIIRGESLDELAALCGKGEQIAAITAKTMAGDIDFQTGLNMRLSQLAGQDESILEQVRQHTVITEGAACLIATMRAHNTPCYLVSGGFTFLTSHIASTLGFTGHFANQLGIENGQLTGTAIPPIIDKHSKEKILLQKCEELGITAAHTVCVGDGANDAAMLHKAGLGVCFEGKPILKKATDIHLDYTDLTGLLYLQGLSYDRFITSL